MVLVVVLLFLNISSKNVQNIVLRPRNSIRSVSAFGTVWNYYGAERMGSRGKFRAKDFPLKSRCARHAGRGFRATARHYAVPDRRHWKFPLCETLAMPFIHTRRRGSWVSYEAHSCEILPRKIHHKIVHHVPREHMKLTEETNFLEEKRQKKI